MRITDVLHKEGTRKPKKVIAKKLGFSQGAISIIFMESGLEGKRVV